MHHLGRWPLQLAARLLETRSVSVGQAAAAVGYQYEAAFNRDFKRAVGQAPEPGAAAANGHPTEDRSAPATSPISPHATATTVGWPLRIAGHRVRVGRVLEAYWAYAVAERDACRRCQNLLVSPQILQFDTADPLFRFGDGIVRSYGHVSEQCHVTPGPSSPRRGLAITSAPGSGAKLRTNYGPQRPNSARQRPTKDHR